MKITSVLKPAFVFVGVEVDGRMEVYRRYREDFWTNEQGLALPLCAEKKLEKRYQKFIKGKK